MEGIQEGWRQSAPVVAPENNLGLGVFVTPHVTPGDVIDGIRAYIHQCVRAPSTMQSMEIAWPVSHEGAQLRAVRASGILGLQWIDDIADV